MRINVTCVQLRRKLSCTIVIQSAFSIVETVCRNVNRWRKGDQIERVVGSDCCRRAPVLRKVIGNKQIPLNKSSRSSLAFGTAGISHGVCSASASRFVLLPPPPTAASPTFNKDILPVLQKHCRACHRPGEIGPMPLLNYEQTRPWAIPNSILVDLTMVFTLVKSACQSRVGKPIPRAVGSLLRSGSLFARRYARRTVVAPTPSFLPMARQESPASSRSTTICPSSRLTGGRPRGRNVKEDRGGWCADRPKSLICMVLPQALGSR